MKGFAKIGCLSHSAALVGSDLLKPDLTLIHALKILFYREHGGRLSLGAEKSQFISWVLGPKPWTGSFTWSALCLMSSFQGSAPGARPLMRSLARRASD